MNDYQLNLIQRIKFKTNEKGSSFKFDGTQFVAVQPENANINKVEVAIESKVLKSFVFDGHETALDNGFGKLIVSFADEASSLILRFNNDVVDECAVPVILKKSSITAWNRKLEVEKRAELIKNVDMILTAGDDMINVIFNIVKGAKYACAELYYGNRKMGSFRNVDGQSYIAITDLAYGNYYVILSLYDDSDRLIVKTDKTNIRICPNIVDLKSLESKIDNIRKTMPRQHCVVI